MTGARKTTALIVWALLSTDVFAASLVGPTVDRLLRNKAREGEVSCVLSETGGREVIYSRWPEFGRALPLGSLVKPFTALAYAESHGGQLPRLDCTPASNCWLPSGHGAVGIEQAIALSCNAYFRSLSEQLHPHDLEPVTARFGLTAPPSSAPPGAYFGLGMDWQIAPAALVLAYEELLKRSAAPLVSRILAGLKAASEQGTASGVARALGGRGALAKTGTAPCTHHPGAANPSNGDGFALVFYPADQPRYTLLVRAHGVPGREAANVAGEILRVIVHGDETARIADTRAYPR
jgi:cell division protein FtsI/penicillin-binding protein 2